MSQITNFKFRIREAFKQCYYLVPDYQREYVWKEKEVTRLLEDITNEMDGNGETEYFIGTIIVSPTNQADHFEVIDGQQRLTTFFLLLCAIKSILDDQKQKHSIDQLIMSLDDDLNGEPVMTLRLEPRYENAIEIITKIIELNADPIITRKAIQAAGISTYGSLDNIVEAYRIIYSYLVSNYPDISDLKKYWGYIGNQVVFIQIATEISSALKIFETINERGVGLNPMDLLKNLIFRQVGQNEFGRLKNEWKDITKALEEKQEKPLRFLRYYLMSNYPIANKRNDHILREDEIYDWIVDNGNAELCGYRRDPFAFVKHLKGNLDCYLAFIEGKDKDKKSNVNTEDLSEMCGGAFSLHYILLLAIRSLPKELFESFVNKLEVFLFYYLFTKTPTKELERSFAIWAGELREIAQQKDPAVQKDMLDSFVSTRFVPSVQSKQKELQAFLENYSLGILQYYRTRYFLAKIAQYVDRHFTGVNDKRTLKDFTVLEIEHILPDNPADDVRNRFIQNNPGIDYDKYKIKLGNLTLLQKPLNIVAGNDYYKRKCDQYKNCGFYFTRSLVETPTVGNQSSVNRINQFLKVFPDWNAATIDERQQLLINLAFEVWKI
ncbi:MAG: DUF262 domain-containing HNH endonuclease family protein [Candidatus Syntrophosphaera sp.]|nr:DUF262 domain-containing HNH endonuclease family protein [Candidatus Syntrophosphaera sp.]